MADAIRNVLPGHALLLELEVAVFELTKVVTRLLLAEASAPRCASCGAVSKDAALVADARAETVLAMTNASGQPIAALAHWFAESDDSLESFTRAEFDPMPSLDDFDAALETAGVSNRSTAKR